MSAPAQPDAAAAAAKAEAKAAADKAAKDAQLAASNKRFQQTQAQVDEVVDIMRMNVDKVLERDSKLSALDDRAGLHFYLTIYILN
jgi:hypothetical protein